VAAVEGLLLFEIYGFHLIDHSAAIVEEGVVVEVVLALEVVVEEQLIGFQIDGVHLVDLVSKPVLVQEEEEEEVVLAYEAAVAVGGYSIDQVFLPEIHFSQLLVAILERA
jgi:hypothetical protein